MSDVTMYHLDIQPLTGSDEDTRKFSHSESTDDWNMVKAAVQTMTEHYRNDHWNFRIHVLTDDSTLVTECVYLASYGHYLTHTTIMRDGKKSVTTGIL